MHQSIMLLFQTSLLQPLLPSYPNFAYDLCCLSISLEKFLALLTFFLDGIILVQKLLEEIFSVKLADKSILHDIFGMVYKQMHHCFGDLICYRLSYNIKI
jgi:hypothetical protein